MEKRSAGGGASGDQEHDVGPIIRPGLDEIAAHVPLGFECRSCGAAVYNHITRLHHYLTSGEPCCADMRSWVDRAIAARRRTEGMNDEARGEIPGAGNGAPFRVDPGETLVVYTDGACKGNPGPAGIGWAVIRDGGVVLEGSRPLGQATNQVAEIVAATEALETLPEGSSVEVRTDSLYVVNTMTLGWKRKANRECWARLDAAVARHAGISFVHVRGHDGEQWNEHVDRLASRACLRS